MSWLTFTEAFTLLTFALWAGRMAYGTGYLIGTESLPGSTTRTFVALVVGIWDFDRSVDALTTDVEAFEKYIEARRT